MYFSFFWTTRNRCPVLPFSRQPSISTTYRPSWKDLHHMCAKLFLNSKQWQEVTKPPNFIAITSKFVGIRRKLNLSQEFGFQSLELFVTDLYRKSKVPLNPKNLVNESGICFPKTSRNHRWCLKLMESCIKRSFVRTIHLTVEVSSYNITICAWSGRVSLENGTMKINCTMLQWPRYPLHQKSIIQLTLHGYKTGCITNRRQYLKNELKCSEMCKCQDCENNESKDLIGVHNYILEDNEIHLNQPMNTYDEVY